MKLRNHQDFWSGMMFLVLGILFIVLQNPSGKEQTFSVAASTSEAGAVLLSLREVKSPPAPMPWTRRLLAWRLTGLW